MKTQTYISFWKDAAGNTTNFERWTYKRLETVKEKNRELSQNNIMKALNKTAVFIEIYASPDGYNKEDQPSAIYNINLDCFIPEVITASVTGNKKDIFINPSNCEACINPYKATNAGIIDFKGVNHAAINRDKDGSFYIFQTSGYTYDKGMFCDMYSPTEYIKRAI